MFASHMTDTSYRTRIKGSKPRCIRTAVGSLKPTPVDFWCTGGSKGPVTHLHSLLQQTCYASPWILSSSHTGTVFALSKKSLNPVQSWTSACQQAWKQIVGSQRPQARDALNHNGDYRPASTKLPRDTHKRHSLYPAIAFQEQKLPHPACIILR